MLLPYLHRVAARENLSADEARAAMLVVLSGDATTPQIAAFLAALRTKRETSEELLGFARAMREKVARIDAAVDSAKPIGRSHFVGNLRSSENGRPGETGQ